MNFAVVYRAGPVDAPEREAAYFAIKRCSLPLLHAHNRLLTLALKMLDQSPLPLVDRDGVNVEVESDRRL